MFKSKCQILWRMHTSRAQLWVVHEYGKTSDTVQFILWFLSFTQSFIFGKFLIRCTFELVFIE